MSIDHHFKIYLIFPAEINRLIKEKENDIAKAENQRDELQKRLAQLERDMQMALTQEKQAHEEDSDRLMRERVGAMCMEGRGLAQLQLL